MAKIVVLGAFRIEVEQVVNQLENQEELCEEGPLKYVTGIYENKRVLVGVTGLGKVRAAAGTQAAIHVFQPDLIVMCGTAGSLSEEVHALDLVVARHLLQHDTGPHEPEPISADPGCSAGLESAARTALRGTTHAVHTGTLVTGDRPVIDPATRAALFDRFHAAAVDMEAAAVAAVCALNHLPVAVVKAITDSADTHVTMDFKKNVKKGAALAQKAVLSLLAV